MKKKIIFPAIAAFFLLGNSLAFAGGTSYATISANSTGESGNQVSMKGSVHVTGEIYLFTNTRLWVENYKAVTGPDTRISGVKLDGTGYGVDTADYYDNVTSGTYYVHLDPDGPYEKGAEGWGKLQN